MILGDILTYVFKFLIKSYGDSKENIEKRSPGSYNIMLYANFQILKLISLENRNGPKDNIVKPVPKQYIHLTVCTERKSFE